MRSDDEYWDVVDLQMGSATTITEYSKPRRIKKRQPIGFRPPKATAKKKPRKAQRRRK